MNVILVDNYDSFTYNLVHYLEQLDCQVTVVRNDDVELDHILAHLEDFDGAVLSPGPGLPEQSGRLMEFITAAAGKLPIFGVCLGMQALAIHSGGTLYNRDGVMHGRTSEMRAIPTEESVLLEGVENMQVGLYHSWAVRADSLPANWSVKAVALQDDAPMVMENEELKAYAVQFHPESILTPAGMDMMRNWVQFLQENSL